MSGALDTLFFKIQNGSFSYMGEAVLFVNAQFHEGVRSFDRGTLYLQQHFKPYEEVLCMNGFSVHSMPSITPGTSRLALLLLPKNMVEARYMMALCCEGLEQGGMLICAADNNAGGGRVKKLMQEFGFSDIEQDSRNKAKVVCGVKENLNQECIDKALKEGEQQRVIDGRFISMPGVFGWDKIDTGSEILLEALPDSVSGVGADFGSGYGYLSDFVLGKYQKIKALYCLDADARAVDVCGQNLEKYDARVHHIWADLTNTCDKLPPLDFVIMNPPFHEGKVTDSSIGVSFLKSAHASLKNHGRLYMVANKHLPYEDALNALYSRVTKLSEKHGFKVYEAVK